MKTVACVANTRHHCVGARGKKLRFGIRVGYRQTKEPALLADSMPASESSMTSALFARSRPTRAASAAMPSS